MQSKSQTTLMSDAEFVATMATISESDPEIYQLLLELMLQLALHDAACSGFQSTQS